MDVETDEKGRNYHSKREKYRMKQRKKEMKWNKKKGGEKEDKT